MWLLLLGSLGLKGIESGGLWLFLRARKREKLLNNSDQDAWHIPFVDSYLERRAGNLNRMEQFAATKLVVIVRKAVNTKAFEHLVAGFVNRNSEWHSKALSSSVDVR